VGVYSWVEHQCTCGGRVQFQTGCGPKEYGSYPVEQVPLEVARDVAEKIAKCERCEKNYQIIIAPRDIATVPMKVIRW